MLKKELYGYSGKLLRINLSDGTKAIESSEKYIDKWLGASGFAIKILYDELKSWVTPYDPFNKIVFGVGPLIGTTAPGANEMSVSTLGPMTGGWASGHSDSHVALQLKYAGYDGIIVEGRAHLPVYLWIEDENIEIRDASHLWGKTTWDALDIVRKEYNNQDLHAVSIGPAGENLVRGACIIQDKHRAFGRCGIGAVMGSKNLKMLIALGSKSVRIAEPKRFMKAVAEARKMFKGSEFGKNGTVFGYASKQDISQHNWKNFQEQTIPEELYKKIDPRETINKYSIGRQSFPGCAVGGCNRRIFINEGPYAGFRTNSNQMEAFSTLQSRLAIEEPTFMLKANSFCNQLGIDVDMAGNTIGWAMECYQRGIINDKDTDGFKLKWGDAKIALEMIKRISYRKGFGNTLAEGCARASEIIGRDSSQYCLHLKKQDLYEPLRGSLGWCLGVTTSTRGGGHTTGAVILEVTPNVDREKAEKVFKVDDPMNPLKYEGKPETVKYMEVSHRINNSLGVCTYNTISVDINFMDLPQLAEIYSAAFGKETTVEDFKTIAMRQLNLEKAFNLRFTDFCRKDDLPAPRELNEPISSGNLKGWKIDKIKYNKMLDKYYEIHGWNKETSYPQYETLKKYGLEYVAEDLKKIGKIK